MKLKNKYSILLFGFSLLFTSGKVLAQDGTTLNFMNLVPEQLNNNPAYETPYNGYFGFPALSNINIQLNTWLSYSDLFKKKGGQVYFNQDKFLSSLSQNNIIGVDANIDIFRFGFRVKKNYFHVGAYVHTDAAIVLKKDVLEFIAKGPGVMSTPLTFSNSSVDAVAMPVGYIGYSREITDKLTLGARFKYMLGAANIYSEKTDISYFSDPTADVPYTVNIQQSMVVRGTIPGDSLNAPFDNLDADYIQNLTKNFGYGLDFGATYRMNDQWNFGVSVLDLGQIKWVTGAKRFQTTGGTRTFTFEGLDILDSITKDGFDFQKALQPTIDSLKEFFKFDDFTPEEYTTKLATKFVLSATYNFTEKDFLGAMYKGKIGHNAYQSTLTLAYGHTFGKNFSITVTNSIIGKNFVNMGVGIAGNAGPLQLYLIVDQVNSFYLPNTRANVNFQFGINFVLGKRIKQTDMIEETHTEYIR